MKGAYDYGVGLQRQCGQMFMERERADFQVYDTYVSTVRGQFEKAYLQLLSMSVLIILSSYIVWLLLVFFLNMNNPAYSVPPFSSKLLAIIAQFGPPLLLGSGTVILLSLWVQYNYIETSESKTISPFHVLTYNYRKEGRFVSYDKAKKDEIIKKQRLFLAAIFGTILLGSVIYNPILPTINDTLFPKHFQIHTLALFVILLVFIPLISNVIVDFQNKVGVAYESTSKNLNDAVKSEVNNDADVRFEIQNNIVKAEPERLGPEGGGAPDLSSINTSPYKDTVYQYAMHILNNADIQSITIPHPLKEILNPLYLRGEQILELKRKLVQLATTNNTSTSLIRLREKAANAQTGGEDMFILPYLSADAQLKFATNAATEATIRDRYLALLNTYVVKNQAFKKGNPLSQSTIQEMNAMRGNSAMKQVVNSYYTKINGLILFVICAYAYKIYHDSYVAQPVNTIQFVSLVAFILLLLLGFVGWFTKELWI